MLGGEAKNAATQFRPSSPPQLGTNNAVRILSTNLKKTRRKTMINISGQKDIQKLDFTLMLLGLLVWFFGKAL